MALVKDGLMTRRAGSAISGGDDIFHVTPQGIAHIEQHSPKRPKLTRGQQRYRDYLNSDVSGGFGKWLKCTSRRAA